MHDQSLHQAFILGGLERRVASLEEAHSKVRRELDGLRSWALRLGILTALWAVAIGSHLSRDQLAELLATLLKVALKL